MRFPTVSNNMSFKFAILVTSCLLFSGIVRAEDPEDWTKNLPPEVMDQIRSSIDRGKVPKLPELPDLLPHTSHCPEEYEKLENATLKNLLIAGVDLAGNANERFHAESFDELATALVEYQNAWRNGDYKTLYRFKPPKFRKAVSSEQYVSLMEKNYPETPFEDLCLIGRQHILQVKGEEFIPFFVYWNFPANGKIFNETFLVMWWRFGVDGWYCEYLYNAEDDALWELWPKGIQTYELFNFPLY